jgi:hypothetical protein
MVCWIRTAVAPEGLKKRLTNLRTAHCKSKTIRYFFHKLPAPGNTSVLSSRRPSQYGDVDAGDDRERLVASDETLTTKKKIPIVAEKKPPNLLDGFRSSPAARANPERLLINLVVVALANADVSPPELPRSRAGSHRVDHHQMFDHPPALGTVDHLRFLFDFVGEGRDFSWHG